MPRGLLRFVVLAAIILVAGIWIYDLVTTDEELAVPDKAIVPVETTTIANRTIREYRFFSGTLRPNAQFIVAPKMGGLLEGLVVDIGDTVEKGQMVAWLEDDEVIQEVVRVEAQLEVAKAQQAEAKASGAVARREFDRVKRLRSQKVASEAEYDAALTRLSAAEARTSAANAQFRQAEAALKSAEIRLSYTKIQADWADEDTQRVVGQRFVDAGTILRPSEPIISVLSIEPIVAQITVAERDYTRMSIGEPVTVLTDVHPGQEFPGEIVRIAPQFNEFSRQALVEIEIDNQSKDLKPGMFIRARVLFAEAENAIVIPASAIVERNGKPGAFVVEESGDKTLARFVPLQLGLTENEGIQVVEPAIEGQVVTLGLHLLDDGTPIKISETRSF